METDMRFNLPGILKYWGMLVICLSAFSCHKSLAQETLHLTGDWKIQPAISPSVMPDSQNWGTTNGIDLRGDWRNDKSGVKGRSWASAPRDTVNNLWYERRIIIPKSWETQHVVVDFRRIEGDAIIYINNKRVAELLRPGGEIDLTRFVEFGKENTLNVFVSRNYTGISRGFEQDVLRYQVRKLVSNVVPMAQWAMGITAPVNIISRPAQAITDVFCITSFRKKMLTLEVEITSDGAKAGDELATEIFDQDNRLVLKFKSNALSFKDGKTICNISALWGDPILWELEKPYSYKARVAIMRQGKPLGAYKNVTFGFREIWTEGKELMMNGHPSKWRLTDLYGANKYGLSVYRLIGYNVGQVQPASNLWWGSGQDSPLMDEDMLNEMDRIGMGCTLPAPSVVIIRSSLLENKKIREAYQQETEYYLKKYRNHPCVLGWTVSMNSANPKFNIWAQGMGRRDTTTYSMQQKVIQLACNMVKQADPTRLAFSHADGSVGDVSTANVYLNFVPLQEREEWPMEWAKSGNMPYSAVEFGPPYWNNFWKGNQFLLTEYLSMYQGDNAYQTEQPAGLKSLVDFSTRPLNGLWEQVDFKQFPGFWKFQTLFTRNTNRAWRTWGVNAGWLQWVLEGYGSPPGSTRFTDRYKLKASITETPSWANPRFHIFKEGNQPLLMYISGAPVHTDKTHIFYSGEAFKKQIVAIWDGAGPKDLTAEWLLKQGKRVLQRGQINLTLTTGDTKQQPINLTAPIVAQRTALQLVLNVKDGNMVNTDTLVITVYPRFKKIQSGVKAWVFDPLGKTTQWLKRLGVRTAIIKGKTPGINGTLIIGREALKPGDELPYTPQDIANGLHVIVMEQKAEVWKGIGFETTETMPRYTYIRDHHCPVLKGIEAGDMINWRGSPDLLPEGKPALDYDVLHAPKWTNTHAVASIAMKTPETIGFTPLLQTEFDMAYSPLLEYRYGKGLITYCSLDLSGRVGVDPAATLLAKNLILAQVATLPAQRVVYYSGDEKGRKLLDKLGIAAKNTVPAIGNAVWVIGGNSPATGKAIAGFNARGGIVLYLNQTADRLSAKGFNVSARDLYKVNTINEVPLLRGIGPNMLRWRDVLHVTAFDKTGQPTGCSVYNDGLILEKRTGKGREVYLQVLPAMLEDRYPDSHEKAESVQLSVIRLNQLTAQLLTNLGVQPTVETTQRLSMVSVPSQFQTLGSWKVLGPYIDNITDYKAVLNTPYPGEQDAIDGGENPNPTYRTKEGKLLDWRKTVNADANGFVDLGKAFNGVDENAIAYVTKSINCEYSQTATLRLGVDFWMAAWVNGKPVLQVIKNHSKRANEYVLNVPLKKGENIITLKVISGKGGFGFWANLAYSQSQLTNKIPTQVQEVSFYSPLYKYFDPYQFSYW